MMISGRSYSLVQGGVLDIPIASYSLLSVKGSVCCVSGHDIYCVV